MTRVTFGVLASSFAANMAVQQNALDLAMEYPQAARVHVVAEVAESFYVDDGLTGADSEQEAIELQKQLQSLFSRGGFLLRKWNSSESNVLKRLPMYTDLNDCQSNQMLPQSGEYSRTLGVQWNANMDHFRLTKHRSPMIASPNVL
jgi:hypothetical protein